MPADRRGAGAYGGLLRRLGLSRELPDGLNTEPDQSGCRTDGSQAQQLALARVVLADPHNLTLNESTARPVPDIGHELPDNGGFPAKFLTRS